MLEAPAARRLAADHRLMLTASARRQLTSGQVDRRLGAALGQLLGHHMIQVRSFAAPRAGEVLRAMSIDCIDELRVRPGSPQTRAVLDLLSKQPAALRPASAHLTGTGKSAAIVVAYAPPSG